MRIAIVTDAWRPQVNGVVRTLEAVRAELERQGHIVLLISPDQFTSMPCPTYPEIRLALASSRSVGKRLAAFDADAIHLATEGPLCVGARAWCLSHGLPFTTAYHTQFPDYVAARTGMNPEWVWRYIRWFHGPAQTILASTPSIDAALRAHGLTHVSRWGRGVDATTFGPHVPADKGIRSLPRPIQLYVGRIAVEKNLAAFLECHPHGSKVLIGDGPARAELEVRYPDAHFLGSRCGPALAAAYAAADVFVFPSLTDTFGLVMIEALACGTPIAAFPVTGPVDVLTDATGSMSPNLNQAIATALTKDRAGCAQRASLFTWEASAAQFLAALAPMEEFRRAA